MDITSALLNQELNGLEVAERRRRELEREDFEVPMPVMPNGISVATAIQELDCDPTNIN